MLSFIFFVYVQKKKKDENLKKAKNESIKVRQQYYKAKKEYAQLTRNYDEYKIIKRKEIEELRNAVLRNERNGYAYEDIDKEEVLKKAIIVKRLHEYSEHGKSASDKEWTELNNIVKKFIPDFLTFLKENDNELSFREIEICILIRLGFKSSDIKILLDISSQHLTNIRNSINLKLFQTKGTKDLDYRIKSV